MSRDSKVYLEDILEAIRKIRSFTQGLSLAALSQDAKTLDAVIRNLEVIGEAVKRLPEPVKQQQPQIEWRKIAGLRDILIHEYFGVNVEVVWDVVEQKLPALEKAVQQLLAG
ncbi:MAG: DUF86 domain-containing protein [Candidatus Omnitrophica bacterium]|nr:DUF86 domain-containing protein [Candidatus Omnitrophota bacterium]